MSRIDWYNLRAMVPLGIKDLADIAIASILIYGVLRLLRIASNRTPLLGAFLMVIIYITARATGLFLTEMLIRSAALGLFVIFAVAFQEEIRRAVLRWRHWRPSQVSDEATRQLKDVDRLVDLAFQCASARIGALIVIKGRESLDEFLNGGIELLAPITPVLMQSVFDTHSPGHDGAIVIREGRIVRICAHLPLSQNLGELKMRGTRHSAGLGLSEMTDALILVVSEERGIVSVAHEGILTEVTSPAELKRRIDRFVEEIFPSAPPRIGKRLRRHAGLKALAVATAALGWFLFARHGDTIEQTFVVPIEYRNIPAHLCLDERPSPELRLTLYGAEPAFALLSPSSLRVRIDLADYSPGEIEVRLTAEDCVYPSDLRVDRIEPKVLRFRLVPCPTRSTEHGSAHRCGRSSLLWALGPRLATGRP